MKSNPIVLAVAVLALSVLACGQYITPTPTAAPASAALPSATAAVNTVLPIYTSTPNLTQESGLTATVVQAVVNLRDEPGGAVIGSLRAGDTVTVLSCADSWCKVKSEQMSGYVFKGCLDLNSGLGCEAR